MRTRLTDVYCFDDGQVVARDQNGNRIPEYSGKRCDVWPLIEAAFARDPAIVIKGASKPLSARNLNQAKPT